MRETIKARLPRGFIDRTAPEIRAAAAMMETIRRIYERYGFEPLETPLVEYTEALGKFLPDQDRPNEGVFSFQDDDEAWLSLRYDLTAPLARYYAENHERLARPYRSYRAGYVLRNEKPGPGRFRQFMQFDADTVGAATISADAEMCMMAADTLEALGIERGAYVIRVNNRKLLDGVMEIIGIGDAAHASTRMTVLRAIDKLDKIGMEGVRALLGAGRLDPSGDFTAGAGLTTAQSEMLLAALQLDKKGEPRAQSLQEQLDSSAKYREGLAEMAQIRRLVEAAGYGDDQITLDPSVVRGLEYYTGPVFEAELLFTVKDEEGRPIRFGSVGGGGRYDGLVGRFLNEAVPATGFSIGVSRLLAALMALGQSKSDTAPGPVVVLVMDRTEEALADYHRMAAELRRAGIAAEVYLGAAGIKAQMKYADRRHAPCVVIAGSEERARGTLQIKDLVAGKEMAAEIADNITWRTSRPAQWEIPRAMLLDEIRAVIASQAEERAARAKGQRP